MKAIFHRVFRTVFWLSFLFVLASVLLVLAFRWAPVSTSGVMLYRQLVADDHSALQQQHWVSWSDISSAVPLAVIAAEDQRFFHHNGFDFTEVQKALEEHRKGKRLRGASTISQQTAKNMFLWPSRSYVRKAFELWFTLLIELLWSKQRILEVYVNIVELGPYTFGVEAASQQFFNKMAKDLSYEEAALLAAVLPNPHRMHVANPSSYVQERQNWILQQMHQIAGTAR